MFVQVQRIGSVKLVLKLVIYLVNPQKMSNFAPEIKGQSQDKQNKLNYDMEENKPKLITCPKCGNVFLMKKGIFQHDKCPNCLTNVIMMD